MIPGTPDTNGATALMVLLVAATVASTAATGAGASTTTDLGDVATVDATPTDPDHAESTHAIRVPLGSDAESIGSPFDDVVIDYTVGDPEADVSNVGANTVERIGIDRGDDDPGTQVDERVETIGTVSAKKDGSAVRIETGGSLDVQEGDEIIVVIRPVQNPQNPGDATVDITVNSQSAADNATGTVTYEENDANTTFSDQTTAGDTVEIDSVTLSEGGFVAIQNETGANPDAVRGHSEYLGPGTHEGVTVELDTPVDEDTELTAQPYLDTNADRRSTYVESGGDNDTLYRNADGNPMGTDDATVTHGSGADSGDASTPTATPESDGDLGMRSNNLTTATPTPTATPESGDGDGDSTATTTATETTGDPAARDTPTPSPTGAPADDTDGDDEDGDATTEPSTPGGETGGSSPGFGPVAALVALAGAALVAALRSAR